MTWGLIAKSVIGSSHLLSNKPCQDACRAEEVSPGIYVFSWADGAGSAIYSDEGALFAVTESMKILSEYVITERNEENEEQLILFIRECFAKTLSGLTALAELKRISLKEYASTLTLAVLTKYSLVIGQIGDGVVVIENDSNDFITLTHPTRGEYENETVFITTSGYEEYLQVVVSKEKIHSLIGMTDGLITLCTVLSTNSPHYGFFNPLARNLEKLKTTEEQLEYIEQFLSSDIVNAKTGDDKTLVVFLSPKTDLPV